MAGGGDEGGSGSAAAGDHNTATPAPSEGATAVDAAATPDYTKSLNGKSGKKQGGGGGVTTRAAIEVLRYTVFWLKWFLNDGAL